MAKLCDVWSWRCHFVTHINISLAQTGDIEKRSNYAVNGYSPQGADCQSMLHAQLDDQRYCMQDGVHSATSHLGTPQVAYSWHSSRSLSTTMSTEHHMQPRCHHLPYEPMTAPSGAVWGKSSSVFMMPHRTMKCRWKKHGLERHIAWKKWFMTACHAYSIYKKYACRKGAWRYKAQF